MRCLRLFLLLLLLAVGLQAQQPANEVLPETVETSTVTTDNALSDQPKLSYVDGLILGLVEGVTEYLPISSTGHLILTNRLLGLDTDVPLFDSNGQPILHSEVDPETGQPAAFTMGDAANAYAIIIQGGAIIAVVIVYWKRLMSILMGMLGRNPAGLTLLRNLIVAFLPAAVLGLLLDDLIESLLFGPWPVVAALVAGALLMLGVERWRKAKGLSSDADRGPDLHELSILQCLAIGFLQCVAMWPGTSRSMMTIVGGYVVGLSPARAAEFSFLLGLVTLTAAAGYKSLSLGPQMMAALDLGPVLFGILIATVSAALAVKWLVAYLTKHGLALFAWYRLVLAAVVAAVMLAG
ncbi:MAG: undecaprenyl-diphosphate phosphatase [Verrucomicrobiota bacterium]